MEYGDRCSHWLARWPETQRALRSALFVYLVPHRPPASRPSCALSSVPEQQAWDRDKPRRLFVAVKTPWRREIVLPHIYTRQSLSHPLSHERRRARGFLSWKPQKRERTGCGRASRAGPTKRARASIASGWEGRSEGGSLSLTQGTRARLDST